MSFTASLSFNSVKRAIDQKKWVYPLLCSMLGIWVLSTLMPSHYHHVQTEGSSGVNATKQPHTPLPNLYELLTQPSQSGTQDINAMVTANVSTSDKVAVIMETRSSAVLIPLILHFTAVLGPSWPIVIYTTSANMGSFQTSHALQRHIRAGRVILRPLAEGLYFPNWDAVSDFLTTPWLWNELAPAEHILLFQADSILCANSPRSVEDFFEYDFIGAPITPRFGAGYNGGLSIRKRSTMLKVLDEWEWGKNPHPRPEDQWYFARLRDLQDREEADGVPEEEWSIKLPSMEIARSFAVETIDYPSPLGLHQPTRFISANGRMVSLEDYCPEYKLATAPRINE